MAKGDHATIFQLPGEHAQARLMSVTSAGIHRARRERSRLATALILDRRQAAPSVLCARPRAMASLGARLASGDTAEGGRGVSLACWQTTRVGNRMVLYHNILMSRGIGLFDATEGLTRPQFVPRRSRPRPVFAPCFRVEAKASVAQSSHCVGDPQARAVVMFII